MTLGRSTLASLAVLVAMLLAARSAWAPPADSLAARPIARGAIRVLPIGGTAGATVPAPPGSLDQRLRRIGGAATGSVLRFHTTDSAAAASPVNVSAALASTRWALLKTGARAEVETALRGPASAGPPTAIASLPLRWVRTEASGALTVLKPVVLLDPAVLSWSSARRQFLGSALVGVEDTTRHLPNGEPLEPPIELQFLGASAEPPQLALTRIGRPYQRLELAAIEPTELHVLTTLDPDGITIPLQVRQVRVPVAVLPTRLPAFGLASATVRVGAPAGLPPGETLAVDFTGTVRAQPSRVRAPGGEATFRSGPPGDDTLRATVDGIPAAAVAVHFDWPAGFLVATLLGLVLGTLAAFVGEPGRRKWKRLPDAFAKGAVFGVLFSIAGALGLDWARLQLADPGTAAAVVIVAALGTYLGRAGLDRVLGIGEVTKPPRTSGRG